MRVSSLSFEAVHVLCVCPKGLVYRREDEGRVDLLLDRVEESVVESVLEMIE